MSRAQLIKSLIKGTGISEDAVLDKYLMSRGINPKFATKDQKVSHSKTGAFITWKNSRMIEDTLEERVDKKDTVTLDIPLLIRIMELAREDIKTDMDLHRVVEKLINIRNKGMLTMKDYNYIAKIHEEVMSQVSQEVIDEITTTGYHAAATKSRMNAAVKVMSSMGSDKEAKTKLNARNAGLKRLGDRTSAEMKKANSGPQKPIPSTHDGNDRGYGKGRYMGDSVEHDDEVVVEMDNRTPSSDRKEHRNNSPEGLAKKDKEQQKRLRDTSPEMRKKLHLPEPKESVTEAQSAAVRWQKALEAAKKKREDEATRNAENVKRALTPVKEDKFQDSMAATQTVGMEVDNPSDADRKSQRSKSARIIKSIYKRKNMKEDLYDHEKDDKPAATYGKKPKMSVTKPTDNVGENKPDAAAILTGGKTLTGQTRDTIEIDPMMKKRPGSDPTGKNK